MPLTFLVRRSTFDSTNALATARASTPGVFNPVDTPSSVRQTPSREDDALRWCFAGAPLETLLPDEDDEDDDSEGANPGNSLNSVDDRKQSALLAVLPPGGRDLPRRDVDAGDCSTK